jgi:hypothetical protein
VSQNSEFGNKRSGREFPLQMPKVKHKVQIDCGYLLLNMLKSRVLGNRTTHDAYDTVLSSVFYLTCDYFIAVFM